MSLSRVAVAALEEAIDRKVERASRPKSTTHVARVTRIDADGTRWVHVYGGAEETPVRNSLTDAAVGDVVQATLSGKACTVIGNVSSPAPTIAYVTQQGERISAENARAIQGVTNGLLQVERAIIGKASIEDLTATNATVQSLAADHVSTSDLSAVRAVIGGLEAETAKLGNLTAEQLEAATAYIASLIAGSVTATQLLADHGIISNLDTNFMHADMSNTTVAWIENGTIKDGAISNAMIGELSANKITGGTINGSVVNVTNLNADNITAGTINGQRIGTGSLSLDKLSEDVYTESEVDAKVDALNDRIDGAIETHTGTAVPTLTNSPASAWNTTALRDEHVGDVYYVVNSSSKQNGYCYRFTKSGSTYSWQLIKDSDVTAALSRLTTAEGKITTFDSDISQLQTDTGSLATRTTSLETRASDTEAALLDKVDVTTFSEVSDTVDSHTQSISQMTETLSNKADGSTVTSLTNRVSKTEQDISGISTTVGELETTVSTKADGSTVETVSSRLDTVSDTVDGHTQTLSSIQSTQTTMQGKLDKALVETTQLWYTKANTTAPAKPTSAVTSTATTGNGWRAVVPAYNASYPNYYYCYQWKYSDGTYGWSSVTRDIAMGESQSASRAAASDAASAVSTANTASSDASTALSTANAAASDASTAKSDAATAKGDASTAKTNAASAVSTANAASSDASAAVTTANGAKATAESAASDAASAVTTANAASSDASEALTTANTAASDASTAKTNAASAVSTANTASSNASSAVTTANAASATAGEAKTTAATAKSTADTAKSTADTAKATADKNVRSSTQLWFTKANDTAPAKPTAKVTSASTAGNAWRTVVPTYSASYPHYFYVMQYELADGTVTWGDVVYDRATTENQSNSRSAVAGVSTLTTRTNEISDTVDGHSQRIGAVEETVATKADGSTVETLREQYAEYQQTTEQALSRIGETYATKAETEQSREYIANAVANYGFQYKKDIVVYGDSDKYYPVYFVNNQRLFSQYVTHEVMITRSYADRGPDDWNTATHRGSLNVHFGWNYGSWGEATYKCEVYEFTEMYSNLLGDILAGCDWGVFSIVYLRGGGTTGALYHVFSDVPFTQHQYMANAGVVPADGVPYVGLEAGVVYAKASGTYQLKVRNPLTAPNTKHLTELYTVGHVASVETEIVQTREAIALKANSSDVYTKSQADGAIEASVSAKAAEIKVTTDGITSEVARKADSASIISTINQSAESVRIQASRVEIDGAAVFTNSDFQSRLAAQGYETTSGAQAKADAARSAAIAAIPTDVSELNNDSGYVTSAAVPTKVSQLANDSSFATTSQVSAAKSEAVSAAASDATSKANAAEAAAKADTASKLQSYSTTAQMEAAIGDAVDGISVGGRNLLAVSGFVAVSQGPDAITGDGWVTDSTPSADGRGASYATSNWKGIAVSAGDYILSWEVAEPTSVSSQKLSVYDESKTLWAKAGANGPFSSAGRFSQRLSFDTDTAIAVLCKVYGARVRLKLERGNKTTDWTPAPEDQEALVASARTWYATCDTAAATVAKAATTTDPGFALREGVMVNVKFANTNSGDRTKLTLDVDGTGAKPIKYIYNNAIQDIPGNGYLIAGGMYTFRYDGSRWLAQLMYNSNTDTTALYTKYYNTILAGEALAAASIIGGRGDGKFWQLSAGGDWFSLSEPLLWLAKALSSGGTDYANIYTQCYDRTFATVYNAFTGTRNMMVYLVGTVSGNAFTLRGTTAADFLTCAVPTAEDGLLYVPIGRLGNQSNGKNYFNYQVAVPVTLYAYVDGSFRQVNPTDVVATQKVWYRSDSATAPTAPSAWVTASSAGSYSAWNLSVPPVAASVDSGARYAYLFSCEQRKRLDGTVACGPVTFDMDTTVIDGASIITGSVTTAQLAANSVLIGNIDESARDELLGGTEERLDGLAATVDSNAADAANATRAVSEALSKAQASLQGSISAATAAARDNAEAIGSVRGDLDGEGGLKDRVGSLEEDSEALSQWQRLDGDGMVLGAAGSPVRTRITNDRVNIAGTAVIDGTSAKFYSDAKKVAEFGSSGMTLGDEDKNHIKADSEEMGFYVGADKVAHLNSSGMSVTDTVRAGRAVRVGGYQWNASDDGTRLDLLWVG